MPHSPRNLKLCSCNGTVSFDTAELAHALNLAGPVSVHSELCRREAHQFRAAVDAGEDMVVTCTQEAPLFTEIAAQADYSHRLQFVNVRELAGWSAERSAAQPKIAALLSLTGLPEPEPVPAVSYRSQGALLIVGPMDAALAWAEELRNQLDVSVLANSTKSATLPSRRDYPILSGHNIIINGFLGSFNVTWKQENPIDLDLCTRCNACVKACPEGAIDYAYQVDLDKCRDHRACVKACGSIGAIDFKRRDTTRFERYDLVLDLCAEPLIRLPHPPQGYQAPGRDAASQFKAVMELIRMVGEFEKPQYFQYGASICAHSRNGIVGCNRCVEVCSTGAISGHGDQVIVEPHLCMGCGGCATVCPSGAMRYAYPRVPDMGTRLKTVLTTYRAAGGRDACILFHDGEAGEELLMEMGRSGQGLPARVIPLALHNTASLGLDLLLGAMAFGASQCVILNLGTEPDAYVEASLQQMELAELLLQALGYGGRHFQLITATDAATLEHAVWRLQAGLGVVEPAQFNLLDEKRTSLQFALDHLAAQCAQPPEVIALPASAPFGSVVLDKGRCTLCMSCVGACPASALMDAPDYPRLKFVERNCIQCGLCAQTCPEDALALQPRLLLTEEVRRERVLNEAEPFHCVRCGKPFATRQMIDSMLGKLSGHSIFAGADGLARLQMCADCRVIDMMESKNELSIHDL